MIFYESPKGKKVTDFSYSQGSTSVFCPHKYILGRHLGLQQRKKMANMEYGNCIEGALRNLYRANTDPVSEFSLQWAEFKNKDLDYKEWQTHEKLDRTGRLSMVIFLSVRDTIGLRSPVFYTYKEKVLREEFLEGSKFESVPDIIDWPDPHPVYGTGPRVIDVKCPDVGFNLQHEGMVALDDQLRVYSWACAAERVALLYFVKGDPDSFPDLGRYRTLVRRGVKDDFGSEIPAGTLMKLVHPHPDKKISEKMRKEAKQKLMAYMAPDGEPDRIVLLPVEDVANVRIQFAQGRILPHEAESTVELMRIQGRFVASRWEIYEKLRAELEERKNALTYDQFIAAQRVNLLRAFPQNPGVRFPNDKCSWCEMLGICLGNKKLAEDRLVKMDEEWMGDL